MKLLLTIATGLSLASAASANAPTEIMVTGAVPTAHVRYVDLDLKSGAGRSVLARRIQSAAGQLCYERNVDPLETALQRRDCYRSAVASGLGQMEEISAINETGTAAGGH